MPNEEQGIQDDLNLEEDQDLENLDDGSEDFEDKLKKAEEVAKNQKIRAEKAERELKKLRETPPESETPKNDYSLQDIRALADVHDEDVEEVVEYAKFKKISVAEAKKSPVIQNFLKEKNESRKVAEATNTGATRRGSNKPSGQDLLEKASRGILPENDADIERLAQARLDAKRRK